ncbi:DUF4153 domain-containing protein [Rhizobium sp.]
MTERKPAMPAGKGVAVLAALVVVSDLLMFRQAFGINLALFAMAVSAGVLLAARRRPSLKRTALLIGLAAFATFPLVIGPSPTGTAVAIVALMFIALATSGLVPQRLARLPFVLCRFLAIVPLKLFEDARKHAAKRPADRSALPLGAGLRVWILPIGLAAVFLGLFAMANPVIDDMLRSIDPRALWRVLDLWRISFWALVAIGVWAMLRPRLLRLRLRAVVAKPEVLVSENVLLSHGSMLRSLFVFNAMFAVQTLLDLVYLWGGADLPDGMTQAQYAHRGAYPLMATALLAGAFVLVAMRRGGPGEDSVAIRTLVHAWIAQNMLLCVSAILRLDLYVEVYSLTELRVAAGIWMGLVAIGLALILLRILLRRSNEWLVAMNLASLMAVLYVTALIDIPAAIARFNVEHSVEVANKGVPLDLGYLRSLGPSAIPALDVYIDAVQSDDDTKRRKAQAYRMVLASEFRRSNLDWRSWSLRSASLADYLSASFAIGENSGINSFGDIRHQLQ